MRLAGGFVIAVLGALDLGGAFPGVHPVFGFIALVYGAICYVKGLSTND